MDSTLGRLRHSALVYIIPPMLATIMLMFLPKTPHYLMTQGREQEARDAISSLTNLAMTNTCHDICNMIRFLS